MEYLDEEDVLEVVDDGDAMSRAGSRLGDGDEDGDLADESVEEEAVESGPKAPSGPDTSALVCHKMAAALCVVLAFAAR